MKKEKNVNYAVTGESANRRFCKMPAFPPKEFKPGVSLSRRSIILDHFQKWSNGTVLHYCFFDKPQQWTTKDQEKNIVRQAFDSWKQLGIGLEFKEVAERTEAEIRIAFLRGDGSWSYVGRDNLSIGQDERTMNFGWNLTQPGEIDTALHEIGHAMGLHHEHQNPNAGIVWNEEAVYAALAEPPNEWTREQTFENIIKHLRPNEVEGSTWDPNSIMHYPFGPGMILQPEKFRSGVNPAGGLSEKDMTWAKTFYPPLAEEEFPKLELRRSIDLDIAAGMQKNFIIIPRATRKYTIQTFGLSDTVMTLFEEEGGKLVFRKGDDDSGEEYNAKINVKLIRGKKYVLRIRLFYSEREGETAVMMW
jgi:hypothetical protein